MIMSNRSREMAGDVSKINKNKKMIACDQKIVYYNKLLAGFIECTDYEGVP